MSAKTTIQESLARYHRVAWRDGRDADSRFVACYLETPLCLAEGATVEAAIADLDAMIGPYLERLVAEGVNLPAPRGLPVAAGSIHVQINSMVVGGPYDASETSAAGKGLKRFSELAVA